MEAVCLLVDDDDFDLFYDIIITQHITYLQTSLSPCTRVVAQSASQTATAICFDGFFFWKWLCCVTGPFNRCRDPPYAEHQARVDFRRRDISFKKAN